MGNIGFLLYATLFVITLVLGLYNYIYSKEVHRIERNIGITLPLYIHQFLKTALVLSFGLSAVVALMALVSFFLR